MTNIFTVANLKGGSGKSELAKQLTIYLSNKNKSVLLVDTDFIHDADMLLKEETGTYQNLEVIKPKPNEVKELTENNLKNFDYVIIDTMNDEKSLEQPIRLADKVISPLLSGEFAYAAILRLNELVDVYGKEEQVIDVAMYEDSYGNKKTFEVEKNERINVLDSKLKFGNPEESTKVIEEILKRVTTESK